MRLIRRMREESIEDDSGLSPVAKDDNVFAVLISDATFVPVLSIITSSFRCYKKMVSQTGEEYKLDSTPVDGEMMILYRSDGYVFSNMRNRDTMLFSMLIGKQ